jgi:hypothetical protein
MKTVHPGRKAFTVTILVLTFASLAHATSSRTWVSGSATAMDSPNTCTRTAPCATFAYALTQTTAGGEIDALDPGDFGLVTIDRAVTIDGTTGAGFASILVASSAANGISINAAKTDVVTIRNLSISGVPTLANGGIVIFRAGTVHIENCVISDTVHAGIADSRDSTGNPGDVFYLYIKDTISRNSQTGDGIFLRAAPAGTFFLIASLTNVRAQDNGFAGVDIMSGVYATLDHCNVTGNRAFGIWAKGASGGSEGNSNFASVAVKNSVSSNNGTGIEADANSIVRVSGVQVFDNTLGLNPNGGLINSYGNNEINGNTTDGAPSNTIPQK